MHYELVKPGDGQEYPFIYCWTDDLPGYPTKGLLYVSLDNGRHTSYAFSDDPPITQVMERCQCDAFAANIILFFIKGKFGKRKEEEEKRKEVIRNSNINKV